MNSRKDKSLALMDLLNSDKIEFIMEAHSGLSAVIVEEAGFKGIWASGLSMSAMTGCRDRNELDVSEVCKIVEWMADHTSIPILVDGDTGGVDVNSARIMVNKLVKAGAAGVCIEDKNYPKHNSFLDNGLNDLADVEEFCGKIRSMKEECKDFVVIARLEEFISKVGLEEALFRAEKFVDAGADAILVHSKIQDCSEIDSFMERWNKISKVPIVIVPTKYYKTPTSHFSDLGISLVIWANHNLRSSINAMKETTSKIFRDQSLVNVESEISTVKEIFRLQRDNEAVRMEEELVNRESPSGTAIILSGINISGIPKTLIKVSEDKTYLDFQTEFYHKLGVTNINVIYSCDKLSSVPPDKDSYPIIGHNLESEVCSLNYAIDQIINKKIVDYRLPIFISYGDILFKKSVMVKLNSETDADVVFVAEKNYKKSNYNEFIVAEGSEFFSYNNLGRKVVGCTTEEVFSSSDDQNVQVGSFIGIIKINTSKGLALIKKVLSEINIEDRMVSLISKSAQLAPSEGASVKCVFCNHEDWIDHDNVVREFLYHG